MKQVIILLGIIAFATEVSSQNKEEADYLAILDSALYNEYADVKMEVFRKEKQIKYYEMGLYRKREKIRIEFTGPAAEKGRRMLNEETSMWMYMPRTGKVMKLPVKQAFMGSDASNRDLMRMTFQKDYELASVTPADDGFLWLELKTSDLSVSYHTVRILFETARQLPVRQDMFALSGKKIKTIEYEFSRQPDGTFHPSCLILKDELLKDSLTKMYYKNVKKRLEKPDVFFTLGSIKQ